MFRRWWLPAGALALGLVVGCGPVLRSAARIDTAVAKVESAWMPNRLDYTVYQPSHRVALAAFETLKAELPEAKIRKVELTRDRRYDSPEGKTPAPDSVKIPDGDSACWLDLSTISKDPILANCRLVEFTGKTRDGQKVDAVIRLEIAGSDQRTVVSVQVGGHGDATGSKYLIDKISDHVQNPSTRPNSPEERASLKAAFDPGPKGKVDFSADTGEITIRMN